MFLFFDTETTGLPKDWNAPIDRVDNWPRLVQLAWLLYDREGNKIDEKEYIIKPEGFLIPEQAASVHGITTEIALKKGSDLKQVLLEFSDAINGAGVLVAHNMNFDEKIMGAEFLRGRIANALFEKQRLCTMLSSVDFCALPAGNGSGYKWPRLSELHIKLFGKDFEDAHDAFVDTSACARCFFELQRRNIIAVPEPEIAAPPSRRQGSLF
jgi:DNA polymerase III epsilon subunit-like protein